jgi:phage terminase large subunit
VTAKIKRMNWHQPDYAAIFQTRLENLDALQAHPEDLPELRDYYRAHPADFISDWGVTFDPRNADIGLPTLIPFILFPKQREWIDWVIRQWRSREPGICEKSRDMGVSWLGMALSCTLCLFHDGVAIGVGSRKGEYVDKIGTLKPLLPKGRMFMEHLPEEFRGGWTAWRDAPFMRISFPDTGSLIAGEGGDDIGRGDRTSIYFVDEAAHLERPELVEASLSQTTNCRIDMSSVKGMANPFAQKRWAGKIDVFIFDWHDDPRKDQAWYDKQCETLDPVVVAQEIDRDYSASVTGIVIPGAWIRSAIGARTKLGIAPSGNYGMALDVADEGTDKNAICLVRGTEILRTEERSGKGGDLYSTTEWAFEICDEEELPGFRYDADGLGAGIRGDARVINEKRAVTGARPLLVVGFRGSEAVYDPEGIVDGTIGREGDAGRTNQDYFGNHKAQGWWALRKRFQKTHRWVVDGIRCEPDDLISLSEDNPNLMKLVAELSQPTYRTNEVGKIIIEKKPNGMKSPNLADAVMIRFAPMESAPVPITGDMLAQIARAGAMVPRRY